MAQAAHTPSSPSCGLRRRTPGPLRLTTSGSSPLPRSLESLGEAGGMLSLVLTPGSPGAFPCCYVVSVL